MSSPGRPVLAFEGVGVVAPDGTTVLDGVTAAVPDDATTVLVGPSGAGKTTLLRLCNRLGVPTSGRVLLRGAPLAEQDPRQLRRDVGMVFQRPVVFPGTGDDNLLVAAPDADERRRRDVWSAVGLADGLRDRPADALSGGEAQRLCIARALLTGPRVLLLDEPTSSLDGAARREVEQLGGVLRERGVALLWVTHDRAQARRVADHVLALADGRLVHAGPADGAAAATLLAEDGAA